ncbi:MAG: hypothetical protein AVDCRST_MAG68-3391 [uncultured Gemmatimonadetes bacterium]|uniref:Uncharacterized protein n=1 Tax=uncultured Gemmatimonadota bacterium TaxID=203437 RepID=A0A6J4LLL5_9BACT|nr:MAG: hypothetical protein AVDCRST_MAG68-3391 [uncultured Gemmatimonadota bacterium]
MASVTAADASGTRATLDEFVRVVEANGRLVTVCNFMKFRWMFEPPNGVFPRFQRLLEAGLIFIDDDPMNALRVQAEEATLPRCSRDITFAALSIEDRGIRHYGNFVIVWNLDQVAHRTSLFVANCVTWRLDRGMTMTEPTPLGFRAVWEHRGRLAAAKHGEEITQRTTPAEFSQILMADSASPDDGKDIFIEGHIWGQLSRGSVAKLIRLRREESIGDNVNAAKIARALKSVGLDVEGFP